MPPPTVGDAWLAGRRFGVVIDAGSSGSRLQIYSWKDPRGMNIEKGSNLAYSLPKVEKGAQRGDDWVKKVEPGISSFADNPEGVAAYLRPLLEHARTQVPPSLQPETPLFLLATAGMRLLTPEQQAKVLENACQFLSLHSHFKIDPPSDKGPCGSSVRIITGEEEGLFGWIAVNYLTDGFTGPPGQETTYGFLDMGGASTQIAFEPSPEHRGDARNLIDVRLRLLGGEEIKHSVFVTTWLGYGTNQARERYVGKAISDYEEAHREGSVTDDDVVLDPCLPKGLELAENPTGSTNASQVHKLVGTGSFEGCMEKTASLLNKDAPCPDTPCLMNGVYVPPINFAASHFVGVSEYWYSSEHIFGLGGAYDFVQYERAASDYCGRDWEGLLKLHDEMKAKHQLGGDGEVLEGGKVVQAGRWDPRVELSRLQMQCFKAAWIVNVLHEEDVIKKAEKKGLGRPAFQSLDTVGEIAISWTLGKMVLEASKEVPAASKITKPIVDPIDDIPNIADSPFQPIRPPFLSLQDLEDRISPHLPQSLTRKARSKREEQNIMMEEGKGMNGHAISQPPSPTSMSGKSWLNSLRCVLGTAGRTPLPLSTSNLENQPARLSPIRSFSTPIVATTSTQYSRASSPIHVADSMSDFSNNASALLAARPHDGSSLSLSSLSPRPAAISRSNSVMQISNGALHHDD
ncbi:hypothetical protein AX14_004542 [Amanita brunnescens Koide BX004]|nr:hypothetical protein AX14_004542 [Amanita brunnescens Koide BX004]